MLFLFVYFTHLNRILMLVALPSTHCFIWNVNKIWKVQLIKNGKIFSLLTWSWEITSNCSVRDLRHATSLHFVWFLKKASVVFNFATYNSVTSVGKTKEA